MLQDRKEGVSVIVPLADKIVRVGEIPLKREREKALIDGIVSTDFAGNQASFSIVSFNCAEAGYDAWGGVAALFGIRTDSATLCRRFAMGIDFQRLRRTKVPKTVDQLTFGVHTLSDSTNHFIGIHRPSPKPPSLRLKKSFVLCMVRLSIQGYGS